MRNGAWSLCECSGWIDNPGYQGFFAWCWVKGNERYLVVINYQQHAAQAKVRVPWDELRDKVWWLEDVFAGETYERNGSEIRDAGLYVDLGPWHYHFFRLYPL